MHLPGMVLEAVICITDVRKCLGYASEDVFWPIMADLVRNLELRVSSIEQAQVKFMAPMPWSLSIQNSPLISQNSWPMIRHGTVVI